MIISQISPSLSLLLFAPASDFAGVEAPAARLARRMTQETVALEAGVDRASLVRIERGQQDPHLSTLLRIAAVLAGVRLAVLDDA